MGITQNVVVSKRAMILFFMVDASGSMKGTKIGTVNDALKNIIPEIKKISLDSADAEIKIAVITFSDDAKLMDEQPESVETFQWNDIEAYGVTAFDKACDLLKTKLSRKKFMQASTSGNWAPAIILMSDGAPTDSEGYLSDNYKESLESLKKNKWFKNAIKVAIAIGKDANKDVLTEFTGNSDAVFSVYNKTVLEKLIQHVTIASSQIGSQSCEIGNTGIQTKQNSVIQAVKQVEDYIYTDTAVEW